MRTVNVTCKRCGESIKLDEAGEHLETCEASQHVHRAIEREFKAAEKRIGEVALSCHFGYSEAG